MKPRFYSVPAIFAALSVIGSLSGAPPGGTPPQVIVSGTLSSPSGEVVWSQSAGPYRIAGGNVTVPVGLTLRILAGTEVQVEKPRELIVRGTLRVEGAADCHVAFISIPGAPLEPDPASTGLPPSAPKWGGIQFVDSMSAENRVSYCEVHDAQTMEGAIGLVRSHAVIDHCTFSGTHWRVIYSNASAPTVQYCTFPDTFGPTEDAVLLGIDNVAEQIKAEGVIPAGHRFLIYRNIFGTSKGHNDVLDCDSNAYPNPILEIRENYFHGALDELADLGGDVLLEGNIFQHVAKDPRMAGGVYANAISTGDPGNPAATVVCVRNIFWDLDHAISCRVGTATIFENNTVVKIHPDFTDVGGRANVTSAISLRAVSFNDPPGDGAYLAGNIFFDLPRVIGGADSPSTKTSKIEAFANFVDPAASLAVGSRPGDLFSLGTGNVTGDPDFVDAAAGDFRLNSASAAKGTGPFGHDFGALVPSGAWLASGPTGNTTARDANFTVGGPGIFAFKWRLNDGAWSETQPIGAPVFSRTNPTVRTATFGLTNLTDGTYNVEVIGQDFAGIWQDETAPTSQTWTVCTPPALFSTLGMNASNDADNDGVTAFEEYAFGLSFTQSDPLPITGSTDAQGVLQIQFTIPAGCPDPMIGPSDVIYRVEVSTDLLSWGAVGEIRLGESPAPGATFTVGSVTGGRRIITAKAVGTPLSERQFLRVKALQQ
ncbi:MAG: hypothetical protein ACR2OZ_17895 [Verrucomicrobiales bacterium]